MGADPSNRPAAPARNCLPPRHPPVLQNAPVIYLDHNASNPIAPSLLAAYELGQREGWANPSSQHTPGRRSRALIEEAREQVAGVFGAAPGAVTFTASGTEALNQVLWTAAQGGRVLVSAVEHPAVLEALAGRAAAGAAQEERLPVNASGRLQLSTLEVALSKGGVDLVAVMAAQNEVGTLQPLEEIGACCAQAGVPFLIDATQALGRVERDWAATPWDYLVLSAHKLRAPRGAAAILHRGLAREPRPLILGGGQELGRRAGTESVAAIVGLGAACAELHTGTLFDLPALRTQQARFEGALLEACPGLVILAAEAERLPQTTACLLPGSESESLLVGLDLAGVHASAGSACSSGALKPSHVLAAMGIPPELAQGRLRFSFGPETPDSELAQAVEALARLTST